MRGQADVPNFDSRSAAACPSNSRIHAPSLAAKAEESFEEVPLAARFRGLLVLGWMY